MDYSDVVKIEETESRAEANRMLATKRYILLGVAPGQLEDHTAYCLYSLGWCGPDEPDGPVWP